MLDLSWTVFRVKCFPEVLFWVAQAFSSQLPSQLKVRLVQLDVLLLCRDRKCYRSQS